MLQQSFIGTHENKFRATSSLAKPINGNIYMGNSEEQSDNCPVLRMIDSPVHEVECGKLTHFI